MLNVLVIVCLILAMLALVIGVLVLQTLKSLERKLGGLEKNMVQLQSDVSAAETKLRALQAQMTHPAAPSGSVHPLIPVLVSLMGGKGGQWLPVVASTGMQLVKAYKAKKSQQKSGANGVKALPPKDANE